MSSSKWFAKYQKSNTNRYKFEVMTDSSDCWAGNAIRFATLQEAEDAAIDLAGQWIAVREWRVVDCELEFVLASSCDKGPSLAEMSEALEKAELLGLVETKPVRALGETAE